MVNQSLQPKIKLFPRVILFLNGSSWGPQVPFCPTPCRYVLVFKGLYYSLKKYKLLFRENSDKTSSSFLTSDYLQTISLENFIVSAKIQWKGVKQSFDLGKLWVPANPQCSSWAPRTPAPCMVFQSRLILNEHSPIIFEIQIPEIFTNEILCFR